MVFSSPVFLFGFLPVLLIIYFAVSGRGKNIVLLIFSLLFYAWGEPANVFIMIGTIVMNYGAGLIMEKDPKRKKVYLILIIIADIGALFFFKYLNFAADTLSNAAGITLQIRRIALPIGISFYTFQIMSYVIDVYRGKCKAQKNLLNLALYVSLFPQLIAGPIVRYVDIEKQIRERQVTFAGFYEGVRRFCIGFAKKILIADQLSPLVETAFSGAYPSWMLSWAGIIAYALQICFDFSGYSDMAIGLGKMFGFDFLENFDYPYISKSIQEFWRRWHISLGSWFRDYLYIPLGGNRKGTGRTYLNLLIVFFCTGLWHGASFNFIAWGLYYAFFLIIERAGFGKILERVPGWIRHGYTMLVVLAGWVLFRADSLSAALDYLKGMVVPGGTDWQNFLLVMDRQYIFCIIMGIVLSIPISTKIRERIKNRGGWQWLGDGIIFLCFLLAICYMVGSGFSPFLYFRF